MDLLNCLENLNWQTIIAIFAVVWYFTHEIKEGLSKLDADVKAQGVKLDVQGQRIDRLYQMFVDLLNKK